MKVMGCFSKLDARFMGFLILVATSVASVVASAQPQQQTCSWGKPAVSVCFPATATSPARCSQGYTCDTKINRCCVSPAPAAPLCPDNTPAVAACATGSCGGATNLVCTKNRLCCPNNPTNAGK